LLDGLDCNSFAGKSAEIDLSDLPKNFNWENVHGFDFTGKVKDQGACGSCYAMATTSMLESRLRIHFGKDFDLSTQFTL
jgi:C1A family cysteine protease